MKIITLWQPWASLIALGLKQYETRSWLTPYRGPLLIHAAKRPFVLEEQSGKIRVVDRDADWAWQSALELAYETGILTDQSRIPFAHQLPLGTVVAIADLTNCSRMTNFSISEMTQLEKHVGDWRQGRYAWHLDNIRPLAKPIPWKGGQGLRNAPAELQTLVDEQVGAIAP